MDALLEANPGLQEDQMLSIGQEINVPVTEATATETPIATQEPPPTNTAVPTTPMATIAIRPGDTLFEIARQSGISLQLLLQANPGLNAQQLQINQEINIPPADATLAPTPTIPPTPTQTPERSGIYVIEKGDSLLSIAQSYGITVDDITAANPDIDPRRMAVGQELVIPKPGEKREETVSHASKTSAPERIVAASIGLDAEVVPVDVRQETLDGVQVAVWEEPANAAGFHVGARYPGDGGNVIISGHNNGQGEVFRNIADLQEGAEVTLYAGGQTYSYKVVQVLTVPDKHISAEKRQQNESWLMDTPQERLTLISYWPYENATHRVVVVAEP